MAERGQDIPILRRSNDVTLELTPENKLAKGKFADVYTGEYKGNKVAIKVLNGVEQGGLGKRWEGNRTE